MDNKALNRSLYGKVFLIRAVEEKIRSLYSSDAMKTPVHLSIGEEAIAAGVCQALSNGDQVYGTYRSHALYLAKGGDLDAFFAEMYGKASGIAGGKAGSMHLSDISAGFMASSAVVASIIPVALGAAAAAKFKERQRHTAVFFGDGATEEGCFWETLNMAALKEIPLLFVCENNGLAIHAKIEDRQAYEINSAVAAFGIDLFESETTDAEEIYCLARRALEVARHGKRPVFLHLHYHRYLEHVGTEEDYRFGYRDKRDYAEWYERDPVAVQREKLGAVGMGEEEILAFEKAIHERIEESVARAVNGDFLTASQLYAGL